MTSILFSNVSCKTSKPAGRRPRALAALHSALGKAALCRQNAEPRQRVDAITGTRLFGRSPHPTCRVEIYAVALGSAYLYPPLSSGGGPKKCFRLFLKRTQVVDWHRLVRSSLLEAAPKVRNRFQVQRDSREAQQTSSELPPIGLLSPCLPQELVRGFQREQRIHGLGNQIKCVVSRKLLL